MGNSKFNKKLIKDLKRTSINRKSDLEKIFSIASEKNKNAVKYIDKVSFIFCKIYNTFNDKKIAKKIIDFLDNFDKIVILPGDELKKFRIKKLHHKLLNYDSSIIIPVHFIEKTIDGEYIMFDFIIEKEVCSNNFNLSHIVIESTRNEEDDLIRDCNEITDESLNF